MMQNSAALVASSLAAAVLVHYLLSQWRRRKEPPGPWGLPLIGYLPFLKGRFANAVMKLSEKYGSVMSLPTLMGNRIVLVTGFDEIREALTNCGDVFNGRQRSPLQRMINPDTAGIAASQGAHSEALRRFSLRTLKNFGLGRAESERVIQQEFEQLKAELVQLGNRPINPRKLVNKMASLVTCRFVFGNAVDYESSGFAEYLTATNMVLKYDLQASLIAQLLARVPFLLRFFPENSCPLQMVTAAIDKLCEFNDHEIRRHRQQLDQNSEPADYIDAFLREQKRRGDSKDDLFNDAQLKRSLNDLFVAGSDTTTNSLNWALVLMAVHSDVQEKVHSELASVIGLGRTPQMQDRPRTPYTDAVLHELQRFCSIATFTLPHTAMWDAKLMGFDIPKGTLMLFGLHSVHFDPKLWERPNEFHPQHFLDSTGTKLKPSEYLVPFGLGRRACMGEALAKMELYLFFSSLFLNFKVTLAEKQPHPLKDILRGRTQGVTSPLDFNVHFELR